jgi:hypothetical protein
VGFGQWKPLAGKERRMFVCKACGKKFKTKDALGGHVSMPHLQSKVTESASANPEDMAVEARAR